MRYQPNRHNTIGTTLFTFVKPFRQRLVANRKMRRFGERSGQVLIAAFRVPFTLLFTVAGFLAFDATIIRRVVPDLFKATNLAGFQQYCRAQNGADAGHTGDNGVAHLRFDLCHHAAPTG